MNEWLTHQAQRGAFAPPSEVSAETREKLQALGYVGVGSPAAPARRPASPIPRTGSPPTKT